MADTKISNLTTATADDGLEIPVNAAGTTKKITLGDALAHSHDHVKAEITDFTHTHVKADIADFTHTHLAADVTDLQEVTEDRIATTIVAGTNLSKTYDDGAGTLTLDVDSHTHASTEITDFAEGVDDRVSSLLTAGTGVALTYNDGAGTLTIDADAHTHTASEVTDFVEVMGDEVNNLLVSGSNISLNYNDAANTLTISSASGTALGSYYDVTDYGAVGDDSTDCRTFFEDALADANAAGGGVVYVPSGTYIISRVAGNRCGLFVENCNNIVFQGAGIGTTVLKQQTGSYGSGDYNLILLNNSTKITIRDMTLDGNKANITANDDTSHLVDTSFTAGDAIEDIRIFNVHFKDAVGDGCRWIGSSGEYGVQRITVAFCQFTDAGRGGFVMQRGSRYAICAYNTFEGISDQDISAETTGGGSAPSHVVVHGNTVNHTSGNTAIAVAGDSPSFCHDWRFTSNTFIGADMYFLRCEDFLIQGNYVRTFSTSPTIEIEGGAARGFTIVDNTLVHDTENLAANNGLIKIEPSSGVTPTRITIRGNRIRVAWTNANPAIRVAAHYVDISDNVIQGNGVASSSGILFYAPALNVTRQDIRVENNTITDFATAIRFDGDANDLLGGLRVVGNRGGTDKILTSDPNLAIGTVSAAKIKHDAFTCTFRGTTHNIAAAEVSIDTSSAWDIEDPDASPREKVYCVSVNPSDTVIITPGEIATAGFGVCPPTPIGNVKVGQFTVQHNGSAPYAAGSDLLSAAHLTDTYTDSTTGVAMTAGITFTGGLNTILDTTDGYPVIYGNSFDEGVTSPMSTLGTATVLIGGDQGGVMMLSVSGTPDGNDAAPVGSMAFDRAGGSGTTLYVKETGTSTSSGWVAK